MRCNMNRAHVMIEAPAQHHPEKAKITSVYTELRPGCSKIIICKRNLSPRHVIIPAKTTRGSVSPANIVPPILTPKLKTNKDNHEMGTDASKVELNEKKTGETYDNYTCLVLEDWDQYSQRQAKDLVAEFGHLFALNDLDLEETSVVRHSIKLTNQTHSKTGIGDFLLANMRRSGNI